MPLDEVTRNKLDADLRDIWMKGAMTVVFVTHSIYEAVFLSSRIIVMGANPGRIVAEVEVPGPKQRDEAFRLSEEFSETCKTLSRLMAQAHSEPA